MLNFFFFYSNFHSAWCFRVVVVRELRDVAMTDMSLETSRQSKTHHISHSCGHTAVFLVRLGVTVLLCFAFIFCLFWQCHLIPRGWWHNRYILVSASLFLARWNPNWKPHSNLDCNYRYSVSYQKWIICNVFFRYMHTMSNLLLNQLV